MSYRKPMTPLNRKIQIEFAELDARIQLSPGYEDESGNYVSLYIDEEYRQEWEKAEGKTIFRALMTDMEQNQVMCVESGMFGPEERGLYFGKLMAHCAACMATHLIPESVSSFTPPVEPEPSSSAETP